MPSAFRALLAMWIVGTLFLAPPAEAKPLSAPKEHPVSTSAHHLLTILAVSDFDRSVRFYEAAFAWPRRVDVPVLVEFELPDGRGLSLYKREAFGLNTGQVPETLPAGALAGTELYFHCPDLDAAIARMEAAGARLLSARAPRGWGDEAAYYADPDGNVLVLARPLPKQQ